MAKDSAPATRRVGDDNPDIETGETLDKIEDEDVEIASVLFDPRVGKKGDYTLAVITLTNGSIYHTGSKVVVERLENVKSFPVLARFQMVASASNPGQKYWTVS